MASESAQFAAAAETVEAVGVPLESVQFAAAVETAGALAVAAKTAPSALLEVAQFVPEVAQSARLA